METDKHYPSGLFLPPLMVCQYPLALKITDSIARNSPEGMTSIPNMEDFTITHQYLFCVGHYSIQWH